MKYLSVCSGIEAASVAWQPLGWEAVGFSEIEKFPSQVLAHHYPDVTNFGDMTKYKEWNLDTVNLLVGGTPCQSFSVAGLRKGLEDPRGNLALTYCGILDHFRPQWFVWENVPGVLSSGGGRDFGSFLGAVAELGYGFAYRVLDAQYFGVAQRRRRVFVVGYFGDWRPAAEVLFEPESLCRDNPPSRKARENASVFTPSSIGGYRQGAGTLRASGGDLGGGSEHLVSQPFEIGNTLTARMHKGMNSDCNEGQTPVLHNVFAPAEVGPCMGASGPPYSRTGNERVEADALVIHNIAPCLTKADQHGVAYGFEPGIAKREGDPNRFVEDATPTLRANMGDNQTAMASQMAVRRLTPVECERLQGFPENYTDIKHNGKETPDGPRYKALGNSMAVPVMAWIGKRIAEYQVCH